MFLKIVQPCPALVSGETLVPAHVKSSTATTMQSHTSWIASMSLARSQSYDFSQIIKALKALENVLLSRDFLEFGS